MITKKNCLRIFVASLRLISAMTGNPPLDHLFVRKISVFIYVYFFFSNQEPYQQSIVTSKDHGTGQKVIPKIIQLMVLAQFSYVFRLDCVKEA